MPESIGLAHFAHLDMPVAEVEIAPRLWAGYSSDRVHLPRLWRTVFDYIPRPASNEGILKYLLHRMMLAAGLPETNLPLYGLLKVNQR